MQPHQSLPQLLLSQTFAPSLDSSMAARVVSRNPLTCSSEYQNDVLYSPSFASRQVAMRKTTMSSVRKIQSLMTTTSLVAPSPVDFNFSFETDVSSPKPTSNAAVTSLVSCWREIQGCNDWEKLIRPLNPLLRREIARYGDLVIAAYKAFDLDPNSQRYLCCKYGKKNLFREVGMEDTGYHVSKYIYAKPDVPMITGEVANPSRWVGYVAVGSDDSVKKFGRRDIVVSFRGTVTNPEWIANFMSSLTPARLDPHNSKPEVKVESGFLSIYTSNDDESKFGLGSCREQLLSEISRLLKQYKDEEVSITLTGHSMGSSLALLLGYDIAELGLNRQGKDGKAVPITVFSYAGPRVGNLWFKKRCEELSVKVLRITNVKDPITKLPSVAFNEILDGLGGGFNNISWSCACYAHVGVELPLDFFDVQNPSCVHDLGSHLTWLRCDSRSQTADRDDETLEADVPRKKRKAFPDVVPLRNIAYNVMNVMGSVSTQMSTLGIF